MSVVRSKAGEEEQEEEGGEACSGLPLSLFVSVCLAADAADVVVSHIKK